MTGTDAIKGQPPVERCDEQPTRRSCIAAKGSDHGRGIEDNLQSSISYVVGDIADDIIFPATAI